MSVLRHRRIGRAGSLSGVPTASIRERATPDFTNGRKVTELVVRLTPYAILLVHLILLLYLFLSPSPAAAPARELGLLLTTITSTLQAHNITHWLAPGAELLPLSESRVSLTPYHRSLTLGVEHGDVLGLALALSDARLPALSTVETHAGLRVFFPGAPATAESALDHREPFIDLHYYRADGALFANFCCACGASEVSACTKKLCGCLVCAVHRDALFPLRALRVAGVSRAVPVPRDLASVLLRRDAADLHPLAARALISTAASAPF